MNTHEIKFRTWFKPHNSWINSVVVGDHGDIFCYTVSLDKEEKDVNNRVKHNIFYIKKEDAIIEFWTGLKDKNGKEIYEGDICTGLWDGELDYSKQKVVIEFKNAAFVETYFGYAIGFIGKRSQLEVIGNIYENVELLK